MSIGRRSVFSKEQSEVQAERQKPNKEHSFRGVVLDICSSYKPVSKFLPGRVFDKGITFIITPYYNCKVYPIPWKGSEGYLRGSGGGTDENLIGREVSIVTQGEGDVDIHNGKIHLDGQRTRDMQDQSIPGYRSLSFFGSMFTDYESQLLNNKKRTPASGEINVDFTKG